MPRTALAGLTGFMLLSAPLGCTAASTSPAPEVQAAPVSTTAIRAVGKHKGDYLPAHNWKIEIDGVIVGGFKEVTGIDAEGNVVAFKDGDDPITHKRAGKAKYKNIVLKRGFVADDHLERWFTPAGQAPAERKSGSVIYLDRAGAEVLRFAFEGAWPSVAKSDRPKIVIDRDTGIAVIQEVDLLGELTLKTKHDTAKNSVGNIR
ncbi:MAG: phage tail protein [Candidatus Sericytochromatia bacterium]